MSVYERYLERHKELGRRLAATLIAMDLAEPYVTRFSGEKLVRELPRLRKRGLRSRLIVSGYLKPDTIRSGREPATASDFRADIENTIFALCRSIVIDALSALEEALKEYGRELAAREFGKGNRGSAIVDLIRRSYLPHESPNLSHLCKAASDVENALSDLPPVFIRDEHGDRREVTLPGGWSAFKVLEMWRQVRNQLVHGNDLVEPQFLQQYKKVWAAIDKAAKYRTSHRSGPGTGTLVAGQRFQLTPGHAVYCLISCQQVVRALRDVLEPTQMRRRLANPAALSPSQFIGQIEYGTRLLGERRQEHIRLVESWDEQKIFVSKIAQEKEKGWDMLQRIVYHSAWLDVDSGKRVSSWACRLASEGVLPLPVPTKSLGQLFKNIRDTSPEHAEQIASELLKRAPEELIGKESDLEPLTHLVLHAWRCNNSSTKQWLDAYEDFWLQLVSTGNAASLSQLLRALAVVNPTMTSDLLTRARAQIVARVSKQSYVSLLSLSGILTLLSLPSTGISRNISTPSGQELAHALTNDQDLILALWYVQSTIEFATSVLADALSVRAGTPERGYILPVVLARFAASWKAAGLLKMLAAWEERPFGVLGYDLLAVAFCLHGFPAGQCTLADLHKTVKERQLRRVTSHPLAERLVNTAIERRKIVFCESPRLKSAVQVVCASEETARVRSALLDSLAQAAGERSWSTLQAWDDGVRSRINLAPQVLDTYRILLLETGAVEWRVVTDPEGSVTVEFSLTEGHES